MWRKPLAAAAWWSAEPRSAAREKKDRPAALFSLRGIACYGIAMLMNNANRTARKFDTYMTGVAVFAMVCWPIGMLALAAWL
jgi:hypothetical protein